MVTCASYCGIMCTHTHTHTHTHTYTRHLNVLYYDNTASEDTMGKCSGLVNPQPQTQPLSQAAILLQERMCKVGSGITGYMIV